MNEYIINYELIENEFRKKLLYGLKFFSDNLNYIIYKSEISDEYWISGLNQLYSEYGKINLSNEIIDKINNFEDLSNILPSLEQLIFYINQNKISINKNNSEEMSLINILNKAKNIANFSQDSIKLIN